MHIMREFISAKPDYLDRYISKRNFCSTIDRFRSYIIGSRYSQKSSEAILIQRLNAFKLSLAIGKN
jgi:hypothetical protein